MGRDHALGMRAAGRSGGDGMKCADCGQEVVSTRCDGRVVKSRPQEGWTIICGDCVQRRLMEMSDEETTDAD